MFKSGFVGFNVQLPSSDDADGLGEATFGANTSADNKSDEEILADMDDGSEDEEDDKSDSDILAEDDSEEEVEEKEDPEPKEEEQDEDEEEKENDDKEEVEEKAKDLTPADLNFKNLKQYDPDIFKKFPELRATLYRQREYETMFGSPEEAKEVRENANEYELIREDVRNADPTNLLITLKRNESLEDYTHNFIEGLYKQDKDIYYNLGDQFVSMALRNVQAKGESLGNNNLILAAKHISRFLWNKNDVPNLSRNKPIEDPEKVKLAQEKSAQYQKNVVTHVSGIRESAESILKTEISSGHDKNLSQFMKETLTEKIANGILDVMNKDTVFISQYKALLKLAERNQFSKEAKSKVQNAILARARRALIPVRAKIYTAAGVGTVGNNGNGKDKKKVLDSTTSGKKVKSTNLKLKPGQSDEDFLAQE
jgi:hypothetical protein